MRCSNLLNDYERKKWFLKMFCSYEDGKQIFIFCVVITIIFSQGIRFDCQLKSAFQLDHYWHAHEWLHKCFCKLWDNQKLIFNQQLWDLWQYPRAVTVWALPVLSIYHWLKFWLLKLIHQARQSYRSHFRSSGWFTRPADGDYKPLFSS